MHRNRRERSCLVSENGLFFDLSTLRLFHGCCCTTRLLCPLAVCWHALWIGVFFEARHGVGGREQGTMMTQHTRTGYASIRMRYSFGDLLFQGPGSIVQTFRHLVSSLSLETNHPKCKCKSSSKPQQKSSRTIGHVLCMATHDHRQEISAQDLCVDRFTYTCRIRCIVKHLAPCFASSPLSFCQACIDQRCSTNPPRNLMDYQLHCQSHLVAERFQDRPPL